MKLATDKQKKFAKELGLKLHPLATIGEASNLIGNKCDEIKAENKRSQRGYKTYQVASGSISYAHGVMVHCDDGNGNEWYEGDEDDYGYGGW